MRPTKHSYFRRDVSGSLDKMYNKILLQQTRFIKPLRGVLNGDWNKEGFKKYLSNTLWMFGVRFCLLAVNFFVSIWVARHLGPTNYGLFNYVVSFGGLFAFFSGFGIDAILGRELLNNFERRSLILGNAIALYAVSSIFIVLFMNITAAFSDPDPYTQYLIFIFSLTFIFQPVSTLNVFFQATVKAKTLSVIQFIVSVFSAILKIIGILSGFFVAWFVLVILVESTLSTLITGYTFFRSGEKISFKLDREISSQLLTYGLPFMLSVVATGVYMKIDQVMLKHMLGVAETGIYSVAVKLTEVWYMIPNLITASVFPAIINSRRVSLDIYYNRLQKLLWLMFITAVAIILPLIFLAEPMISMLFGPDFQSASKPFIIYVWSSIPTFLLPALTAYMTAEHRGTTLLFISCIGSLINIALNLILIPRFGITGSAIATLIAYCVPMVFLLSEFYKYKKYA